MAAPRMKLRVLETSLYVDDMEVATNFYRETLGLTPMVADSRMCAFDCGPGNVLLLFQRGASDAEIRLPGGTIPPHDAVGRIHVAFAIDAADLSAWEKKLGDSQAPVEARITWPRGGESIYFRDPDDNLLELATPGLWANY